MYGLPNTGRGGFTPTVDTSYVDKKVVLQTADRNISNSPTSNPVRLQFGVPQYQFQRSLILMNLEVPNVIDVTPADSSTGSFQFVANAGTVNITMPTGAPATGTALAAQLQTLLAAVDAGTTVTYDAYTRKLTITDPLKADFQINFPHSKVGYRNATAMGFNPPLPGSAQLAKQVGSTLQPTWGDGQYNTNTAAANVLVSAYPCNFAGPTVVFLKISDAKVESDTTSGIKFTFSIPVNASYGQMIDYHYNERWAQTVQNINPTNPVNFDTWELTLLDEFGQPIDMQQQNWTVTLGLTFFSGGN